MKICMFSNLFPPIVSGSSTQSASLARELVKRDHQVSVIAAHVHPDSPASEMVDGVTIHRLPALRLPRMDIALNFPWLSWTFTPANQQRIAAIIDQFQPDVLHLHNHMFDLAFSAIRSRRRSGIPLVITIHTAIKHANPLYNLLLYPADRFFLRRLVIRQADALIYPDVNIEEYASEAFGGHDGKIIPYGIQINQPDATLMEQLRNQFGLHGKRVILSLGHVHEIRNRRDLVAALPAVLKKHPNPVLLVVGAVASQTPRLLARELGVENAVIFTDAMPHSSIPSFLALADLEAHWLNQDVPEKTSLGIASLEAMSAGKVVIAAASSHTYGPNLLRDSENFIQVSPNQPQALAQTLIRLLDDASERERIGEAARRTIQQHFSWDSVCDKTLALYQSVTGKGWRAQD